MLNFSPNNPRRLRITRADIMTPRELANLLAVVCRENYKLLDPPPDTRGGQGRSMAELYGYAVVIVLATFGMAGVAVWALAKAVGW